MTGADAAVAIANVRTVVRAQLREPVAADLPEGQRVEVAEVPVRRVGIYAPGGRAVKLVWGSGRRR